jgi:hypothetical protein
MTARHNCRLVPPVGVGSGNLARVQPKSFDEDLMTEWSVWVLDNGLPPLPDGVDPGESVPVAQWVGPRFAAVLHIQWMWSEDHNDDSLSTETQVFVRRGQHWEIADGQGGSSWFDPPFERPSRVGPRTVAIGHEFCATEPSRSCCAVDGFVGSDAAHIEVEDADGMTRRPVESPFGAVIVCSDGAGDATFRVLDGDGRVLGSGQFGTGR